MKLWYINIWLNPETGYDTEYRYEFTLHTRFISNYFSKQMRKKKNMFETDGTFSMISVNPTPNKLEECKIVGDDALKTFVLFDKEKYEKIKGTENFEYYLELLEEGFVKAGNFKEVPLDTLLNLINEFRKNGYKNEWLHKKKRLKEQDIEVILNCYFTTLDFRIVATINKISTKEELCSGIVIRSKPNEIIFDKEFRNILIDRENIIITEAIRDSPRVLINLKDAMNRKLSFRLIGNKSTIEKLSYSLK